MFRKNAPALTFFEDVLKLKNVQLIILTGLSE
jgi:hypothetical protein